MAPRLPSGREPRQGQPWRSHVNGARAAKRHRTQLRTGRSRRAPPPPLLRRLRALGGRLSAARPRGCIFWWPRHCPAASCGWHGAGWHLADVALAPCVPRRSRRGVGACSWVPSRSGSASPPGGGCCPPRRVGALCFGQVGQGLPRRRAPAAAGGPASGWPLPRPCIPAIPAGLASAAACPSTAALVHHVCQGGIGDRADVLDCVLTLQSQLQQR